MRVNPGEGQRNNSGTVSSRLTGARWRNYGGNIELEPPARPVDLQDLRRTVADASPQNILVVGLGGTWSRLLLPTEPALLLDLQDMPGEIRFDAETGHVWASGWLMASALSEALARHGRQLEHICTWPNATLAGLVATGSHGSSRNGGHVHQNVVALRLVDARGLGYQLDEHGLWSLDDGRLLLAGEQYLRHGVVHRGMLGIVTELEFRTVPASHLAATQRVVPEQEMLGDDCRGLLDHLDGHAHASCAWAVRQERCVPRSADPIPAPAHSPASLQSPLEAWFLKAFPSALMRAIRAMPSLAKPIQDVTIHQFFFRRRMEGPSWEIQTYNPARLDSTTGLASMEYSVPLERAPELIRLIRPQLRDHALPLPINFRRSGDRVYLECPWLRGLKVTTRLFMELERSIVSTFGADAHAHVGKVHWVDPWPRLPDDERDTLLELKRVLDPEWIFTSAETASARPNWRVA
jgi:FAD/FMN-containing dehydrogenase